MCGLFCKTVGSEPVVAYLSLPLTKLASSSNLQVDPLDDIDVINLELALADLAQIEKRMDRLKKGEQKTQDSANCLQPQAGSPCWCAGSEQALSAHGLLKQRYEQHPIKAAQLMG
jgi:ribosome-binding ATPase YchF (GTP1/OBG family)